MALREKKTKITAAPGNSKAKFAAMLLTVILFVAGSVFGFMSYSNRATETAVNNVSLFYLEELASNVSQVFTSHFGGYFKELRLALLATHEVDMEDESDLKTHLVNMAERGGFLFYALMDEEGNVYISDEAYRTEFLIGFLQSDDFHTDKIALESHDVGEDVFILAQAAPGGTRVMDGKKIVVGARGVLEATVKHEMLLRGEHSHAIVHMIKEDGDYLIAGDNPKLVEGENYFSDLSRHAEFAGDYTAEQMIQNIQSQASGNTAYYVDGELYFARYSYLPRSGWSIVTTIPFHTVSATLEKVAGSVTLAGVALMLSMLTVCCAMFWVYIRQKKRSAELNLKRLEAEERNRAKSSFLSNMSHDIRTPMNAIIGFTNLALQQENSQRVQDYLTKISMSGKHLLGLINDVLDMSRIESGKMTIDECRCDLSEVLRGLQAIIQGQADAKEQRLLFEVQDVAHEHVWCDRMRLDQVLLNLLSNAVKFTPSGGSVTMSLREKASDRPGYGLYEFRVKDTGIGMSKEFSEKVFEPFEREQSSTVNKIQGTGLGMSIAKNIVDMMGGSIEVETESGKGTEFIILVHLRLQEDFREKEDRAPLTEASFERFRGKRVLLAEDNELNREIATEVLSSYGFIVESAENGREVLDLLQASAPDHFDVILMDVNMPVMDGYEAARAIRGLGEGKRAEVPILAMTANAFEEDRKASLAAGMNGHITKPIDMDVLLRVLSEVL